MEYTSHIWNNTFCSNSCTMDDEETDDRTKRYDKFGNEIKKGKKNHRITFADSSTFLDS